MVRLEMMRDKFGTGKVSDRIVMRVLKFIQPPNIHDDFVQQEGELLKRYDPDTQTHAVWSVQPGLLKWLSPRSRKMLEDRYLS